MPKVFADETNNLCCCFCLGWTKVNGPLGNILPIDEMFDLYKTYLVGATRLMDVETTHLFCFLQEMIGCVSLQWKEAAFRDARYSDIATQSDKTFGFFVLKYYGNILSDNDSISHKRKQRMSGKMLEKAMLWFNEQSKALASLKMQHQSRVHDLDIELTAYINEGTKWHVTGTSIGASDSSCFTEQKQREELDNLHDFSKLFGKNKDSASFAVHCTEV